MQKIVLLALALCGLMQSNAQDLIVTKTNDSINARIYKEKKNALYFYFVKNGETRSTLLLRNQVTSFQKDFFEVAAVSEDHKSVFEYQGQRWIFNLEAGYGYRLGRPPNGLDPVVRNYVNKLRSGFHWGLHGHYFVSEGIGFGVNFNIFQSSESTDRIETDFSDGTVEQGLANEIKISFIGPSVAARILSANQRNAFVSSLAIGYMGFREEERAGLRTSSTTGSTIGYISNLGYEFGVSKSVSLGFSTSVILGFLNKVELEESGTTRTINVKQEFGNSESLSRINVSINLRIKL